MKSYTNMGGEMVMKTIFGILANDWHIIPYRPELNKITEDLRATLLLQQIVYWHYKKGGAFCKFKEPCEHPDYRPGTSFTEELGFTRKHFDSARSFIATRAHSLKEVEQLKKKGLETRNPKYLVIYRVDSSRRTWYYLNEELLTLLLQELYANDPSGRFLTTRRGDSYSPDGAIANDPMGRYLRTESTAENTKESTEKNTANAVGNSKDSDSPYQQIVDFYYKLHEKKYGEKPLKFKPQWGKSLKEHIQLLRKKGWSDEKIVSETKRRLRNYFKDDAPFLQRMTHDLTWFLSRFSAYREPPKSGKSAWQEMMEDQAKVIQRDYRDTVVTICDPEKGFIEKTIAELEEDGEL